MIANVPTADVIVTNPTHYAVAIRYKHGEKTANGEPTLPVVVAKGVDFLALKIRELGGIHKIEIVEDPPLARTLYKIVDVDKEIPYELYRAVGTLISFVYHLKAGRYVPYNKVEINEDDF